MVKRFVSIIIPTLNEEKYIEATLRALKNQDYKGKYEIIVADGMSKDKTVKIAKEYADKIIHIKKKGIARGRNAGAAVAQGDILVFIDADTIVLPNMLSEFIKVFKNKKVVGACCPIMPLSCKLRDIALFCAMNEFFKTSIRTEKAQIPGICSVYRQSVFKAAGGFDENMDTLEDYDLSERIDKLGKFVFVESTFVLTSVRRIEAWGRTKAAKKYIKMYLKYLLTGNSLSSKDYKPVR